MPDAELHAFYYGSNICHQTQIILISNAKIHLCLSGCTVRFIGKFVILTQVKFFATPSTSPSSSFSSVSTVTFTHPGSESGRSTPSLSTYSDGKSPSTAYVAAPRHFHVPGRSASVLVPHLFKAAFVLSDVQPN